MITNIKLRLSSGKEIELTGEEYEELKSGFSEKVYVPYVNPPFVWADPYVTRYTDNTGGGDNNITVTSSSSGKHIGSCGIGCM